MLDHLCLQGCRHDILGHYLKALGVLQLLAKCAAPEHRNPDAEGWWDTHKACFCLRSPDYPTRASLVEFFEKQYRPTPSFSLWNTGGGLNEKKELEFSVPQDALRKKFLPGKPSLPFNILNEETVALPAHD